MHDRDKGNSHPKAEGLLWVSSGGLRSLNLVQVYMLQLQGPAWPTTVPQCETTHLDQVMDCFLHEY